VPFHEGVLGLLRHFDSRLAVLLSCWLRHFVPLFLTDLPCCAVGLAVLLVGGDFSYVLLVIVPQAIYDYFEQTAPGIFKTFDDMYPVVSCKANFDEILIPADHVSRSPNDTYYVSAEQVLRCHTSAHQAELLRTKQPAFLVTGQALSHMPGNNGRQWHHKSPDQLVCQAVVADISTSRSRCSRSSSHCSAFAGQISKLQVTKPNSTALH
jgi:hypothetical protein